MNDALGQRMKLYEAPYNFLLPRRTYTIVRVDGRAFHTYLKHAKKPFDGYVANAMEAAAAALCKEMAGAKFAYTQSDEISVLLTDFDKLQSQPWFNGEVQKITSIAASIVTGAFNHLFTYPLTDDHVIADPARYATFDARVYTIPQQMEVANYFIWRQKDAMRNAVSMAAHAHFSHGDLLNKNTQDMKQMLLDQCGIHFENYPERFQVGSVVTRETYEEEVSVAVRKVRKAQPFDPNEDLSRRTLVAKRSRWTAAAAPEFSAKAGGFLADHVPAYEDRLWTSQEVTDWNEVGRAMRGELPLNHEDPLT